MASQEVRFRVRLTPRGGADRVDGVGPDGALHARVTAAPVDDAANTALVRLIARELDLPRSAVRLVGGARRRDKSVAVEGMTAAAIQARWPGTVTG
ncbi:MAG: DUF167 domain-containing protein [Candidatus Limnocylindrales bacterium]